MNYAQDKYSNAAQTIGPVGSYTDRLPPPQPISALQEASECMDTAISQVMSMAEILAARLSPLLRPAPSGVGTSGDNKVAVAASPVVESMFRQRSRINAIGAQLQDLLDRVEV